MAIGVVEVIYTFKYLIFIDKKHRENDKSTETNLVLIRAWQP